MNTNTEHDFSLIDLDDTMEVDESPEESDDQRPEDNESDDTPFLTEDNLWEDMHDCEDWE